MAKPLASKARTGGSNPSAPATKDFTLLGLRESSNAG